MIEITDQLISPEHVINRAKTGNSGCVVTYVGLIRDNSRGKAVLSVEYEDPGGTAERDLRQIADEAKQKWQLNNVAICHRIGKLKVGDINLVVAIAVAHRQEGLAACRYIIDRFKERLPSRKKETYTDGTVHTG